jgi:flagellar basal-body rod protein FlgG
MNSAQANVDILAHNIANGNSFGYKEMRGVFHDLMYQDVIIAGSPTSGSTQPNPAGLQFGLGSNMVATIHDFTQGALIPYSNDQWTMAIDGPGLFEVTLTDGSTAYTRNGVMVVDSEGALCSVLGHPFSPGITIPRDHTYLRVDSAGNVFSASTQAGLETAERIGTLNLAMFVNFAGLRAVGDTLYAETEGSGPPIIGTADSEGFGVIRQRFIEDSNVNTIEAITNLIKAQRLFEFNSNALQTVSEMLKRETNITT